MFEIVGSLPLLDAIPLGIEGACIGLLPGIARKKKRGGKPLLVQEQAGFHLGITPDIRATGRHAAQIAKEKYRDWLAGEGGRGDTAFKRQYFTIGVGGGNTGKNEYKALLRYYFDDFNWLDHIRFFFLEETCNEENWEGTRDALVATLIVPLAKRLVATRGARELAQKLKLKPTASRAAIIDRIIEEMTFPIEASAVDDAIEQGERELALQAAGRAARNYQQNLRRLLGPSLSLHLVISGIGRHWCLPALHAGAENQTTCRYGGGKPQRCYQHRPQSRRVDGGREYLPDCVRQPQTQGAGPFRDGRYGQL